MLGRKGMTLLELIAVVAVLAIIVSLTAPDLVRQVENGREHERARYEEAVNGALARYIAVSGQLPALDSGALSADEAALFRQRLFALTGVDMDLDAYDYFYNSSAASFTLTRR